MSTTDRIFNAADGLVFAELTDEPTPGNEREPKPDADGNAKPEADLGFMELVLGGLDEDGKPPEDGHPEGGLGGFVSVEAFHAARATEEP